MAEATIGVTEMSVEHSRIHDAWLWMRELLRKAGKGFASGVSRVRVTITRYATTTAATAIAAGAQIGLATRAGWNGASAVATSALGLVAKGAVQVARAASWVVGQIGRGLGWFVGLFHKKAGNAISNANAQGTQWRQERLDESFEHIDTAKFAAHASITSATGSAIGRTTAGVIGVAGIANLLTGGAVAAKAVSVLGPKAAMLFGPAGLLVTAVVGAVAGLFSWFFRREEVADRAYEMLFPEGDPVEQPVPVQAEPVAQPSPVVTKVEEVESELVIDMTEDGKSANIKGDESHVDVVAADKDAQEQMLMAEKSAQLKAAGLLPATNEMVKAALIQEGKAVLNANGEFAKNQMDRMRKLLRTGQFHLETELAISA